MEPVNNSFLKPSVSALSRSLARSAGKNFYLLALLAVSALGFAAFLGGDAVPAKVVSADQPKFALLVGITNYKSPSLNKIDGCVNNVPLLAKTLTDSYGFLQENVVTLLDEKAGKATIIDSFRQTLIENAKLAKRSGKEAVIVYYFCGHGSQYADQDGDENDGLDETFVAYDSRTNGTPDILDDEIDDLKAELRPLTSNTTIILESCHSGTGSRGPNDDHRYVSEDAEPSSEKFPPYKRKFPPTRDEDASTYTEIAAAASTNTAKSETAAYCECDKPYSLMTKALVEALNRADQNTTYRSLLREVSGAVAERSRQDPQVEGSRDSLLFGGAAKRKKPYIEVDKVLPGSQIVIRAGSIHGLREGSQITIYSAASTTDRGDDNWLTNGVVKTVRNYQSIVQLPTVKESPNTAKVSITSHVVLTSPIFGGGPVFVSLDAAAGSDTKFLDMTARIRKSLAGDDLVSNNSIVFVEPSKLTPATAKGSRGLLRLRKDKFAAAFPGRSSELVQRPSPAKCSRETELPETLTSIAGDQEIYYLDDGIDGGTPLYGKYFLPGKDSAAEIAQTIRNFVMRTNLENVDNVASTLPSQIELTVNQVSNVKFAEKCVDGEVKLVRESAAPKDSDFVPVNDGKIPFGSVFNFRVKNISGDIRRKIDEFAGGQPLFVTAIFLRNNGDIDVIYPRLGAKDPLGDGIAKTFGGYVATKPAGKELLLLIVSKNYVDFSFYESSATSRSPRSPLERLLKQTGLTSRDSATLIPDEPDEWGIVRLDLDIGEHLRGSAQPQ